MRHPLYHVSLLYDHLAGDEVRGVVVAALAVLPAVVAPEVGGEQLLVVPHHLAVAVELARLACLLLGVGEVLEHPGVCLPVSCVVDLLVVVTYGSRNITIANTFWSLDMITFVQGLKAAKP